MKAVELIVFAGCALAFAGCRILSGGSYPEICDEGFEPLADEEAMRARFAEGGDLVFRYEFLTSAPFGGAGVLPVRADNTGRQMAGKDANFAGNGSYVRKSGMWNYSEVILRGGGLEVYVNGQLVTKAVRVTPETRWIGFQGKEKYRNLRVKRMVEETVANQSAPEGFEVCFDGRPEQLRTLWRGVTTEGGFDNPYVRMAATKEELDLMQIIADEERDRHWSVRNGALCFDGFKGGYSLATKRDYGDFELWADWRIVSVTGDSGLYLRGCPQVQVWDAHNQWHIGSGGLYNNRRHPSKAPVIADRQVGDWNRFHVIMRGSRVTVWLNGELVVDGVPLENHWNRKLPLPATGPIELQSHGDPVEWRNVYVRELEAEPQAAGLEDDEAEAVEVPREEDPETLRRYVMLPKNADDLLAQVRPADGTAPEVLKRIEDVSRLVMRTDWEKAPSAREIWTCALLGASERTTDDDCRRFYLKALRGCGKASQADRVMQIGFKSGSKSVRDLAAEVSAEMMRNGRRNGR